MDLDEQDIQWYMKDFNLDRDTVLSVLDTLNPECVKQEFWENNPNLPETVVNDVVRKNIAASFEYHQYRTFNNDAP